jgi:putative endonuclease
LSKKKDDVRPWYVYMVRCARGALYTGITDDLRARVQAHNEGKGAKSVIALGLPVRLVWHEQLPDMSSALKREYQIKQLSKIQKELMVTAAGREGT